MTVHRFYLPPEQCGTNPLWLTGSEAHHAVDVLRLRRNDSVTLLDGEGTEYVCSVQEATRQRVGLGIKEKHSHPPTRCKVTLVQAVPRGKLIESIIQKATELGVFRIVPALSERVVSQFGREEAASKAAKWRLVAVQAIKQCGSPWLPRIEPPVRLEEQISRREAFDVSLVGSLQPASRHPRACFEEFHQRQGRPPRSVCVWVGPEGDFAPTELAAILSTGATPVTLGPLVLRSETAAIYSLSVINHETQWAEQHWKRS